MGTTDKFVAYVDGQATPEPFECFAIRGQTMIDLINPATGKTAIYGKTLEDCRQEKGYEQAERMTIDEFCKDKAEAQDAPVVWEPTTKERYREMLECLPPALWLALGFLVGEPWDHHALTGAPRYQAFIHNGNQYLSSNRPMTRAEFKALADHAARVKR
jgi:hypothetical protein